MDLGRTLGLSCWQGDHLNQMKADGLGGRSLLCKGISKATRGAKRTLNQATGCDLVDHILSLMLVGL